MGEDELFNNAQQFFISGHYKESIEEFTRALGAGSDPAITYLTRGIAYLKINMPDKAIEDLGKVLEVSRKNATAYYYRGTASMLKGNYNEAVSDFKSALEIDTNHRASLFARGLSLLHIGKYPEGLEDLKTALAGNQVPVTGPEDTYGWKGEIEKALAVIEKTTMPGSGGLSAAEMKTLKKWRET